MVLEFWTLKFFGEKITSQDKQKNYILTGSA